MRCRLVCLFAAVLLTLACAGPRRQAMTPLPNRDAAVLTADDVVRVMLRAGFVPDEVLQYGTQLRNDLAIYGSSQVRNGGKVRAIFAVQGQLIHVSTMLHGNFAYNLQAHSLQ